MMFPHALWMVDPFPISIYDDFTNPYRIYTVPGHYVYYSSTSTQPDSKLTIAKPTDKSYDDKRHIDDIVADILKDLGYGSHMHSTKCHDKKGSQENHFRNSKKIGNCNKNKFNRCSISRRIETLPKNRVDNLRKQYAEKGWNQDIFELSRIPGTDQYNKEKILRDFRIKSNAELNKRNTAFVEKSSSKSNDSNKNEIKSNLDKKRIIELKISEKQRELSMYKDRIESLNKQVNNSISEIEKMKSELLNLKI